MTDPYIRLLFFNIHIFHYFFVGYSLFVFVFSLLSFSLFCMVGYCCPEILFSMYKKLKMKKRLKDIRTLFSKNRISRYIIDLIIYVFSYLLFILCCCGFCGCITKMKRMKNKTPNGPQNAEEIKNMKKKQNEIDFFVESFLENKIKTRRSILLLGRVESGKSSFIEVLRNVCFMAGNYSRTSQVDWKELVISDRKMRLSVCDTPGLDGFNDATNLKNILVDIRKKRRGFYAIFIFLCVKSRKYDVESVHKLLESFGKEKERVFLIISKSERLNKEEREESLRKLKECGSTASIIKFFDQRIFFFGSLQQEWYENGNLVAMEKFIRVVKRDREEILNLLEGIETEINIE